MSEEITVKKAWVTRYALGGTVLVIKNAKANRITGHMRTPSGYYWAETFYPDEWYTTEAEAIAAVKEMKADRITHLESELARTRALDPAKVVREAK